VILLFPTRAILNGGRARPVSLALTTCLLPVLFVGCQYLSPSDGQAVGLDDAPVIVGPSSGGLTGQEGSQWAPVFQSFWSTTRGTSDTAVGDGGKWNNFIGSSAARSQFMAVVPGAEHGWTLTPNILQITNMGQEFGGKLEQTNAIPETANNFYVRAYIRVTGASTGSTNHSIALNGLGDIQATLWSLHAPRGTTYQQRIYLYDNVIDNPTPQIPRGAPWGYQGPTLAQGEWYRFEWHIEYYDPTNPLRMRVWPRIYNMAGALVADASHYVAQDDGPTGTGTGTLAQHYAAGVYVPIVSRDLGRKLAMGYEGSAGNNDTAARWFYAGVEVRTDTWVGPIQ